MAGDATLTLAGLRVTPKSWDKQANFATLERYTRQAAAQGAQLVITPEGFLEGYLWSQYTAKNLPRERYFEAGEAVDGPLMVRIRALARELKVYLAVGFAEQRSGKMYNSVVIFSPRANWSLDTRRLTPPMTSRTTRKESNFPLWTRRSAGGVL